MMLLEFSAVFQRKAQQVAFPSLTAVIENEQMSTIRCSFLVHDFDRHRAIPSAAVI